ncbi:MAG: sulfotransferase family 2 domain-containing protein [Pseudomonadales bacterium]|nr:sulfotransferase family 2 domain-containing protein [Pseudomonadales bacterium]
MSAPELVFLHIPKTAGTSQQTMFNEHYGRDSVFWIGRDCDPDIRRYPAGLIGARPVVGGHKHLAFYPRNLDALYCALVRDPVQRAISLFVYYTRPELADSERERRIREAHIREWQRRGLDADSMSASIRNCRPFRREISNFQCRYLSRGRARFASVCKSLQGHDFLIGSVAHHQLFHDRLAELLDWVPAPPLQANRSRDDYARGFLQDAELVALIAELNGEDDKLVRWVQAEQGGLWSSVADLHQRRRRLWALPLRPGMRRQRQWQWPDAATLWPSRGRDNLPWPLNRMLVAEPARLVYLPSPGAVDAGIKRMMLELSSVPHKQALQQLGIDRVVRDYATGLVLGDYSPEEVQRIAASRDYFRFAIVYEPVARLVEIYRRHFVERRRELARWPRMYRLLAAVQGMAQPDCDRGISFRQFVSAVTSGRFAHPLWQRQSRCLPWPDSCDALYRPQQLALLERDLARQRQLAVRIERAPESATTCPPFSGPPSTAAAYADTPAGQLPADSTSWLAELVDAPLYRQIQAYYPRDFTLYNRTADDTLEVART